jgi:hypothetical protein
MKMKKPARLMEASRSSVPAVPRPVLQSAAMPDRAKPRRAKPAVPCQIPSSKNLTEVEIT